MFNLPMPEALSLITVLGCSALIFLGVYLLFLPILFNKIPNKPPRLWFLYRKFGKAYGYAHYINEFNFKNPDNPKKGNKKFYSILNSPIKSIQEQFILCYIAHMCYLPEEVYKTVVPLLLPHQKQDLLYANSQLPLSVLGELLVDERESVRVYAAQNLIKRNLNKPQLETIIRAAFKDDAFSFGVVELGSKYLKQMVFSLLGVNPDKEVPFEMDIDWLEKIRNGY